MSRKAAKKPGGRSSKAAVKANRPEPGGAASRDRRIRGMDQDSLLSRYVEGAREEFERSLRQLVEIPSVSSDPTRREDIDACAETAALLLRRSGATARVVQTAGHPVVIGEFNVAAAAPTLTIYNHLDVQPADSAEWTYPPFSFRIDGDRYRGRGATDDKGPALTALFAARYAAEKRIPLNLRFLWELEEEIGSPNFEAFLRAQKEQLATDSIVVSDTVWVSRKRPAIAYGLRGLLGATLRLRTGTKDVHSGLTGGAARNPISELVQVLDQCFDGRTGRVRIPGFYSDVVLPSPAEMKGFLASGFQVSEFVRVHGLKGVRTRDRAELLRRIWGMPTFEIHGLVGGYTGEGIKTIVPPMAEVKLSMRLVPKQNPRRVFQQLRSFVRGINPDLEVRAHGFLEPYLGASTGPYADTAAAAIHRAFGRKPTFVREGGSIGAVVSMARHLKAPIVLLGLSLPEHGYHAPNEYYDWGQASGGMRTFVSYFEQVARLGA